MGRQKMNKIYMLYQWLQGAMTVPEVKKVEEVVNTMAGKNEEVYAKETGLAVAKSIQGLRAVFDEVRWFCWYLFESCIETSVCGFECVCV